ncbi:phosphosulfolactate synthase [Paenibacillus lutrae]|uniref:Phosphosulfolactate synthase n=1 Tax=Paenibacillus lutrae TaxID=2078573 RepID=A0A7X3FID5_9BACL|nr:phosphosulfolactate synthase [Paenibacillus lutrae]MVP00168.1 phosphosulfolactate synthase [Paenibacillus lutrae]
MEGTSCKKWHPTLADPTRIRQAKPRTLGKTMVMDKGLGLHAYEDLLQSAGEHVDYIKLGFGTSALYPGEMLRRKIEMAKEYGIDIYPGGTFLEVAVRSGLVSSFFDTVTSLGFTCVEISDGTIEMDRTQRSELIVRGIQAGLKVVTEYGKKCWGSSVEVDELVATISGDIGMGAELVTIEARESGVGVGIFDEEGSCKDQELLHVLKKVPGPEVLLWEAPLKNQQIRLLEILGPGVHLGNVAPADIISLEALRRGLRSDTFHLGDPCDPCKLIQGEGFEVHAD